MLKDFSFSPFRRIRKAADYQQTFHGGKRLHSPLCTLYYRSNNLGYPRIGVIASKRNAKRAVQRNKIKRVARELFRLQRSNLKSVDIVVVAKRKASDVDKEELKQCLDQLFKKLKPLF